MSGIPTSAHLEAGLVPQGSLPIQGMSALLITHLSPMPPIAPARLGPETPTRYLSNIFHRALPDVGRKPYTELNPLERDSKHRTPRSRSEILRRAMKIQARKKPG